MNELDPTKVTGENPPAETPRKPVRQKKAEEKKLEAAPEVKPVEPVKPANIETDSKVVVGAETVAPTTVIAAALPNEATLPRAMLESLGKLEIPGLSFLEAETVDLSMMKIMTLIYGDSGSGKTHFACMAEDVVIALVDTQGFATIRSANPRAVVAGHPDKAMQGQPRLQNMAQVRAFFKQVASGALLKAGVKTIVLDHITELQQLMVDEILAEKRQAVPQAPAPVQGKVAGKAAEVAPAPPPAPPKGKAPELTKADWGTLATRMRNFMRMLRGLPHHIVVLALAEATQDESTGRRMMFPKLAGSAGSALPSYFNIVGYIYKTSVGGGPVQRVVMLDGDDRYYTKSYGPLQGIVQADLPLWQRLLAGETGSAGVQGASAPGGATGSGKPRAGVTTDAPTTEAPAGGGGGEQEY